MVDVNATKGRSLAAELGSSVVFIETDVSSWEAQVKLFEQAYEWSGYRFDFLASNAGASDERNLTEGLLEEGGVLKRPDYKPIETNLLGSIYAIQLFAYYISKSKSSSGGKIVITSSGAGQFPVPSHPIYSASMHGVSSLLVLQNLHSTNDIDCWSDKINWTGL